MEVAGLSPQRHTGKSEHSGNSDWRRRRGALEINDDLPQNMPKPKRDLDPMSIGELNEYIDEMHEEIERVRAEIAKKEAHRSGVESLFKK
ncbi:MAG: DUF1192 domain-containing protein [Alphaproteobacteria bacterium]|jgi:uncharacterized small protein (DUF1192 family)|nr:DUF1192 domain-containing protein [Alphaproteobacteria bacterium]